MPARAAAGRLDAWRGLVRPARGASGPRPGPWLVKVNVDTSPQLSQRFGAQAIPTLLVLRRGQVIARQAGAVPLAALRTWADNALAATG